MRSVLMTRRSFALGLASAVVGLPQNGSAEPRSSPWNWATLRAPRNSPSPYPWAPWKKSPSIVVMSAANDARLPDVERAVNFWNLTLRDLGSPFHLGSIEHIPEQLPGDTAFRSRHALEGFESRNFGWYEAIDSFRARAAAARSDVVVALMDSDRSYVTDRAVPGKLLMVVQRRHYVHNIIAHEFGHVVGLGHRQDPVALMCGYVTGLSRCDVGTVTTATGYAPLTIDDTLQLRDMYPPTWSDDTLDRWKGDPPPSPNGRFGGRLRAAS